MRMNTTTNGQGFQERLNLCLTSKEGGSANLMYECPKHFLMLLLSRCKRVNYDNT